MEWKSYLNKAISTLKAYGLWNDQKYKDYLIILNKLNKLDPVTFVARDLTEEPFVLAYWKTFIGL